MSENLTPNLQDPEDYQQGKPVKTRYTADLVTPRVTNLSICRCQADIIGPPECLGPSGTSRSHLCSCQAFSQIT